MTHYFEYELSSEPTPLLKDVVMRKANKWVLCRAHKKKVLKLELAVPDATKYILDRRPIIHRVSWNIPATSWNVIIQNCDCHCVKSIRISPYLVQMQENTDH